MGRVANGFMIAGCVMGALAYYGWSTMREADERRERERRSQLDIQRALAMTAHFAKDCPAEAPIEVSVKNGTAQALKSVRFHLAIYEDGRSTDLNPMIVPMVWDRIVGPTESASLCFAAPPELPRARYLVKVERDMEFDPAVFYAQGEFIPAVVSSQPSDGAAPGASSQRRAPRPAATQ